VPICTNWRGHLLFAGTGGAHCREIFLFEEAGPAASQKLQPSTTDRASGLPGLQTLRSNSENVLLDLSPKTRAFRMDSIGLAWERSRPTVSAWKK